PRDSVKLIFMPPFWLAAVVLAMLVASCATQTRQVSPAKATCIDLSQYCSAQLTDSLNSPTYVKENNFASLPKGRQIFNGVPFQIDGVLQLSGKKVK
ncbi:hypothetical protein P6O83_15815, partial [Clostridium perfringens]|nr:hypothetical protein [Clostridium perfringens]